MTGSYGEPEAMSCRSIYPSIQRVDALRAVEGWPAEHVAVGLASPRRSHGGARRRDARVPLGVGDEAGDGARLPGRGRGGRDRPRRAGRAARLDLPASARPRLGPAAGGRRARSPVRASGASTPTTASTSSAQALAGPRRDAVRRLPARGGAGAARPRRRATRAGRAPACTARSTTCSRSARELLAPTLVAPETLAEATSVQFPGLVGVLPGLRPPGAERLGPRLRAARRRSRRTGPARATRRAPSATSAAAAPSSGSTPTRRSPSAASPTSTSATGRWTAWPALSDAVLAGAVSGSVLRAAVTGLSLALLCAACGSTAVADHDDGTGRSALPGWTRGHDAPGISQLAPDLSGLDVTAATDARALVQRRRCDPRDHVHVRDREGRRRGAEARRGRRLPAAAGAGLPRRRRCGHGPGVGLRLSVPRPSRHRQRPRRGLPASARGRRLTLVELVSARGFDAGAAQPRPAPAQSQNSGRMNSSNVSRSQLATTDGVSARIEAVRGMSIVSATSPK